MLTGDLLAFVRSSLPEPPSRILEIGAGRGELAGELRASGYEVTAIDPAAEADGEVQPLPLLEIEGAFDAAVAVVSLHHVDPLEESCAALAAVLTPGAMLVIDEIDASRFDERAADWWLSQRRALGFTDEGHTPSEMVEGLRGHIHPLEAVCAALGPYFALGQPVRVPYLHRWELLPSLREAEVDLIASGLLPAVGARLIGLRTDT
jgi:SAM-dependent methyltransferase